MISRSHAFTAFIGVATFSKLMLNTARRMVYPFAPALARGLGVPLTSVCNFIDRRQPGPGSPKARRLNKLGRKNAEFWFIYKAH
ncbi:hypothetical protein DO021_19880 [Desulfobacter hydrogenophilus]|uniref:Uncharacterized protein n=1 Tax=Desulfobacter hydrogenophilus TaxID=2291 RepID=A0A328F6U2_9BACT|nr:hypothetical protein [Desulfobacter hydrogenophilus]NDY74080.1 hypothetical protein [Desulfobacter hydrogenophilus]QBH14890.1 hypothetical protein EYB58_19380 [Desulfobacter hydrogenophilus]RAM00271.1 hypothetical protein DO021_19880 [Desulfobacter hydrogenophilus]